MIPAAPRSSDHFRPFATGLPFRGNSHGKALMERPSIVRLHKLPSLCRQPLLPRIPIDILHHPPNILRRLKKYRIRPIRPDRVIGRHARHLAHNRRTICRQVIPHDGVRIPMAPDAHMRVIPQHRTSPACMTAHADDLSKAAANHTAFVCIEPQGFVPQQRHSLPIKRTQHLARWLNTPASVVNAPEYLKDFLPNIA